LTDPVIVWYNGGPGCSSLYGLANEHGPYVLPDGGNSFIKNDYAWNNFANMIYIEAPAGVGYSICGDASECVFDDDNSADDNLVALINVLNLFPEINQNDLYLSGESYAGIYVPKLAARLDAYIKSPPSDTALIPKFKGFMVGNGVTDWSVDTTPAWVEMAYWYGLYEDDLYFNIKKNCDFAYAGFVELSDTCNDYLNRIGDLTVQVNIYDVFGICYSETQETFQPELNAQTKRFLNEDALQLTTKKSFTSKDYTPFLYQNSNQQKLLKEIPPCTYATPMINYFNDPQVRASLNIKAES
jgi:hypothetical protein